MLIPMLAVNILYCTFMEGLALATGNRERYWLPMSVFGWLTPKRMIEGEVTNFHDYSDQC